MQAILTQYYPESGRIIAKCARGKIYIPRDFGMNMEQAHIESASILIKTFIAEDESPSGKHPEGKSQWRAKFASGQLPDGTYAHVFID